jgi:hypothetical protein
MSVYLQDALTGNEEDTIIAENSIFSPAERSPLGANKNTQEQS